MKESLLSLKNKISVIKSLEVGINSEAADQSNYDIILISVFDSLADLEKYQAHPEHQKVADFVGKVRENRACID